MFAKILSVFMGLVGSAFVLYGVHDFLHWFRVNIDTAQRPAMMHLRIMTVVWLVVGVVVFLIGQWIGKRRDSNDVSIDA